MITPKKLEDNIVKMLLPRLENETEAFYFYRSASNYCNNIGFLEAAKYFAKESADELVHAKGIEDYLVDWNVTPILPVIEKPVLKFSNIVDVIEQAYEIEFALLEAYEKTAMDIFKAPDLCTFNFIQKYIKIQVDSVAEYSTMLNMLEGVDVKEKCDLLLLEEKLFGE